MIHPSLCAGVAQLVEHFLAKEDVASSSLVARFRPLVPRGLPPSLKLRRTGQRDTARNLQPGGEVNLNPKGESVAP
jgi:hypothetical protein